MPASKSNWNRLNVSWIDVSKNGHGKMSVAVCATSAAVRAMHVQCAWIPCMCVEYVGFFIYHYKIYGSTKLVAAFYSKE